tara:strand:- start:248 stop:466 length:219 start_codon:yes stop_codon:yes gene_type:complete
MKAIDIRFEQKEFLIERLTNILNHNNVWEKFKKDITFDLPNIKLNPDSPIWNEIEELIIDKILEDNNIDVWD